MRFFVHPLFILTALVAICFATTGFFIALTMAVLLHECAHAIVAKSLGAVISRVTLTPFGGALRLKTNILTPSQKRIIYLAGPIASLLFSMFFGILVWIQPIVFIYLEYLVAANFLVGIINLIPIYPFDGGKILAQLVPVKIICLLSNLAFAIIIVLSLTFFNWWWIFFATVMLIQINWDFKQIVFNDKFNYRGGKKLGKFVRCAVLSSTTLLTAYRMVNYKHPTEFVVLDCQNKFFYENDLEEWLIKYQMNTKIAQCLPR